MRKSILFITGTRADFGKLKHLIRIVENDFDVHIFVTGMHLLSVFGSTYLEVEKAGFKNLFLFVNQHLGDPQDHILSKSLNGLSDYVKEIRPDLIVVHGDRIEALAGALVGALNNIFVAHIEGGEVSGTIDESIRHAITKFSHFHFVANNSAKQRLLQLGEDPTTIYVIGSPDLDAMHSSNLPPAEEAFSYYEIPFDSYAISILHPVTTELDLLKSNVEIYIRALLESNRNYVVVYPNNDPGFSTIIESYQILAKSSRFKLFPSIRFEYFLTLMRSAQFIIGNSSSGIREAPFYAVPSINVGTRQTERSKSEQIIHTDFEFSNILSAISRAETVALEPFQEFGQGDSSKQFLRFLLNADLWTRKIQKHFVSNFS